MPSLVKKTISGRPYYYLVWSGRVNGKPRTVRQVYLGPAEVVAQRLAGQLDPQFAPQGSYAIRREFGASTALWSLAERIGLVDLIDSVVPSQHRNALTTGQYLTLAAINRCVAPISKKRMAQWHGASYVSTLLPATAKALQGQRFWDAMNEVSEQHIQEVEEKLLTRVHEVVGLDVSRVVFDATNFFTFIDTRTPGKLAQRGHNKAKRDDLRQVSVSLLVALDFAIPLFHDCYAGNVADSKEFAAALQPMVRRMQALNMKPEEVTVAFDKGNNSEENFKRLNACGFHFVGSLSPSQHADLAQVPLEQFSELTGGRLAGLRVFRRTKTVFGAKRTVVVTWNPRLAAGQEAALLTRLYKKTTALREVQERLLRLPQRPANLRKRTTVSTVTREVNEILSNKEVRRCIEVRIAEEGGLPSLEFEPNNGAISELKSQIYGKNIVFTDHEEWSTEDIILAYRSQYKLERQFRNMKDHHGLCWWPQFHWTDQKIRVHALYCVIGLLLLSLLQRQLAQDKMIIPIPRLIQQLRDIEEITQVVVGGAAGHAATSITTTLTKLNQEQHALFESLGLARFVPKNVLGTTSAKRRQRHQTRTQRA